jgi:Putative prokaryotic signal transducing protein
VADEVDHIDRSGDLELETIYHAEGSSLAELEALEIKGLLESNGIPAIMVGDPVLPNLPFEIKVARHEAECARQLIAEARCAGRP